MNIIYKDSTLEKISKAIDNAQKQILYFEISEHELYDIFLDLPAGAYSSNFEEFKDIAIHNDLQYKNNIIKVVI